MGYDVAIQICRFFYDLNIDHTITRYTGAGLFLEALTCSLFLFMGLH